MEKRAADIIVETLKERKLRVTPQRYAVYANLLSRTDHPTVDQLLTDLNQNAPISSQATVYSSLKALQAAGLVREVLLEEGVVRYDANVQPHHHFRCNTCGKIEDIAWNTFPAVDIQKLRPSIEPERYEITIYGVCATCQAT